MSLNFVAILYLKLVVFFNFKSIFLAKLQQSRINNSVYDIKIDVLSVVLKAVTI